MQKHLPSGTTRRATPGGDISARADRFFRHAKTLCRVLLQMEEREARADDELVRRVWREFKEREEADALVVQVLQELSTK